MISKKIVVGEVSTRTAAEIHPRILNHRIQRNGWDKRRFTFCRKNILLFKEKICIFAKEKPSLAGEGNSKNLFK